MSEAGPKPPLRFRGRLRFESDGLKFFLEGREGRFGVGFDSLADLHRARRGAVGMAALLRKLPRAGSVEGMEGWILLRRRPIARFRVGHRSLTWRSTPIRFATGRW